MMCERCGENNAQFAYTQTIGDEIKSVKVCKSCMDQMLHGFKQTFSSSLSLGDLQKDHMNGEFDINHLFASLFGTSLKNEQKESPKACSKCNSTFQDLVKFGKVGCPNCYFDFSEELTQTLRSIHGSVRHIGRVPAKYKRGIEKKNKIAKLKEQLKEAIQSEEFEQASVIRDEIKLLEKEGV